MDMHGQTGECSNKPNKISGSEMWCQKVPESRVQPVKLSGMNTILRVKFFKDE
jgi:hypothetical protein